MITPDGLAEKVKKCLTAPRKNGLSIFDGVRKIDPTSNTGPLSIDTLCAALAEELCPSPKEETPEAKTAPAKPKRARKKVTPEGVKKVEPASKGPLTRFWKPEPSDA